MHMNFIYADYVYSTCMQVEVLLLFSLLLS